MSVIVIILILKIVNQILIQSALQNEIDQRYQAVLISRQQSKVNSMFFDLIAIQSLPNYRPYLTDLEKVEPQWEKVETSIFTGDASLGIPEHLPEQIVSIANQETSDFEQLRTIFISADKADKTGHLIHIDEGSTLIIVKRYTDAFHVIFVEFSDLADQSVQKSRTISLLLFGLSVFVILAEVFLVMIPTMRQEKRTHETIHLP
jgi:hypothetical protein